MKLIYKREMKTAKLQIRIDTDRPNDELLCEQCLCNTKTKNARWGSTPIPLNISCGDGYAFCER